jgi:hypothetical protein
MVLYWTRNEIRTLNHAHYRVQMLFYGDYGRDCLFRYQGSVLELWDIGIRPVQGRRT